MLKKSKLRDGKQRWKILQRVKNKDYLAERGFESEEEKLKKLLASNFGRMKNDEAKQRKVAVKYVELCGYKNGGDRKSDCDSRKLTQEEFAEFKKY